MAEIVVAWLTHQQGGWNIFYFHDKFLKKGITTVTESKVARTG
jgi:hypothetical protein